MGVIGSKRKLNKVHVPMSLRGYHPPEPPFQCVDDIRPTIPWFEEDNNDDEFDWKGVEDDLKDNGSTLLSQGLSAATTPRRAPTPGSILLQRSSTTGGIRGQSPGKPKGSRTPRSPGSGISQGQISLKMPNRRDDEKKLSFDMIDEHARKATKAHMNTYTALIDYLILPIRFHAQRDILTARAIIVWLNFQNTNSTFVKADVTTPKGLLRHLSDGTISYAGAYAILCREAGLQCVVIEGVCKKFEHEAGQLVGDESDDRWTALYVQHGGWQLVHPYWICKGMDGTGSTLDDWIRREVENDGVSYARARKILDNYLRHWINEDFFMPRPEVYVYNCFADDIRWQLLPPDFTVQSREDFSKLPFLLPAFFRLGLTLLSAHTCMLKSEEGMCRIEIACEKDNAHRLSLNYELYLKESKSSDIKLTEEDLERLVLHSRQNKVFLFEIRFPIEGTYRLEIHGGYHNSHSVRLCQFQLQCTRRLQNCVTLPVSPDKLMWGPGPDSDEVGLLLPSRPTGLISVYPIRQKSYEIDKQPEHFENSKFSFLLHKHVSRNIEYTAELIGLTSTPQPETADKETDLDLLRTASRGSKRGKKGTIGAISGYLYRQPVDCNKDNIAHQLTLTASVPHEGEFALVIRANRFKVERNRSITRQQAKPVCVYLLRTTVEQNKENVHQKLARSELQTVMSSTNVDNLRKAVDKCYRMKMDMNDDEIVAGESKWEYLSMRKELLDAIHRRNFRVTNETLHKVSKYRFKGALLFEIRKLFRIRKQLKLLRDFRKYVPSLRDASKELLQMPHPPPEVHITMAAVFLLLDEPETNLEDWQYIKEQLRQSHGEDAPAFKKMWCVAEMAPSKNTMRKIVTLMAEYNYEKVERTSPAAAQFYIWMQKIMAVLQDEDLTYVLQPGDSYYRAPEEDAQDSGKTLNHLLKSAEMEKIPEESALDIE